MRRKINLLSALVLNVLKLGTLHISRVCYVLSKSLEIDLPQMPRPEQVTE